MIWGLFNMGRGQKTCKQCGAQTGPRSYKCPDCGYSFNVQKGITKRNRKRKGEKVNWRELQSGDFIRVLTGSGPYWPLPDGEREPMGYYGVFKVMHVHEDGLGCYPADKKNSGFCFIYMGEKKKSKIGTTMVPHKIRKVPFEVIDKQYQK